METRRTFLIRGAATFAGLACGLWPGFAQSEGSIRCRGLTHLTPAYGPMYAATRGFVDILKQQVGNTAQVEFFDSGTLMPVDGMLDGLRERSLQFIFHATPYLGSELPALAGLDLPGVCQALYANPDRLAMRSPLWNHLNAALAEKNLLLVATGGMFEPEYLWSTRHIESISDLRGLRCRTIGPETDEIAGALEMEPVRLSSEKLYLGVQRGAVDVVMGNISTVAARNLPELLKHCFRLPVSGFSVVVLVCRDVWSSWPERLQQAFHAAGEWYDANQARYVNKAAYPQEYWPLLHKAGVATVEPSAADMADLDRRSEKVWAWWRSLVGEDWGHTFLDLALGRA